MEEGQLVSNFGKEMEGIIYRLRDNKNNLIIRLTIPPASHEKITIAINLAVLGFIDTHLVMVYNKDGQAHILDTAQMFNYIRVLTAPYPEILYNVDSIYTKLENLFTWHDPTDWSMKCKLSTSNSNKLSLNFEGPLLFFPLTEMLEEINYITIESIH